MLVSRGPGRPAWEKGFFVGGGWQDEHVSVWDELVGQDRAVETLRRAVAGGRHAMTHAWLFVGPPGSGRSNAARAFAAAQGLGWGLIW